MFDQYGERIQLYDFITYPIRNGSNMEMRTAKVTGIDYIKNHLNKEISVVKATALIHGRPKKVTLKNSKYITVVFRSQVSPRIRTILDY